VRSMLGVTTVAAIYIGALKAPGDGWVVPVVVVTLAIIAYGVQRIAISPSSRPFWLSYFACMLSMAALLHLYASSETYDAFGYKIATAAWQTINGDSSSRPEHFQSFTFYLKVALATCVPFVVALAMTYFSRGRAGKSSKE
jgi:hypothetical protein